MACEKVGGSCSLCSYCGTEYCPRHQEMVDNVSKIYVYAVDHTRGEYNELFKAKTKKEVLEFLEDYKNKSENDYIKWRITYKYKPIEGTNKMQRFIKVNDYIEITIVNGQYNWYTAVHLAFDTVNKIYYTFDPYHTEFCNNKINRKRIWANKIRFIDRAKRARQYVANKAKNKK